MKPVTATILDLINQVLISTPPVKFGGGRAQLAAELVEGGYLRGRVLRNEKDIPCGVLVTAITMRGRIFRHELEDMQGARLASRGLNKVGIVIWTLAVAILTASVVKIIE